MKLLCVWEMVGCWGFRCISVCARAIEFGGVVQRNSITCSSKRPADHCALGFGVRSLHITQRESECGLWCDRVMRTRMNGMKY